MQTYGSPATEWISLARTNDVWNATWHVGAFSKPCPPAPKPLMVLTPKLLLRRPEMAPMPVAPVVPAPPPKPAEAPKSWWS